MFIWVRDSLGADQRMFFGRQLFKVSISSAADDSRSLPLSLYYFTVCHPSRAVMNNSASMGPFDPCPRTVRSPAQEEALFFSSSDHVNLYFWEWRCVPVTAPERDRRLPSSQAQNFKLKGPANTFTIRPPCLFPPPIPCCKQWQREIWSQMYCKLKPVDSAPLAAQLRLVLWKEKKKVP